MSLVWRWLLAFGLTVAIEIPLASWLLRGALQRRVALALVAQLASHPLVWFVFPELPVRYWTMIAIAETWAVVVEALIFVFVGQERWQRALGISLMTNGASYAIGLALRGVL